MPASFFLSLNILAVIQIVQALAGQIAGTLHRRNYFYIGEQYVSIVNESIIAAGQIYVEHLVPTSVTQPLPIVFIHGRGMTGTNFLNTPDGRLGWADFFLGEGYELYIIDQPSRGRSPWQNGIDGPQSSTDVFTVESRFTASEQFNLWSVAHLHTQWPGSGTAGDPIFDDFYASTVPTLLSDAESEVKTKNATVQLLDRIGPIILLTHSQAGSFGWQIADARPNLVKTIIAVEPMGPPFINAVFPPNLPARPFGLTETPLTFSPPVTSPSDIHPVIFNSIPNVTCFEQTKPARQLVNLARVPVTVITSESSYHAMYDNCTVRFLKQAGVSVEHVNLPDFGIVGNGHMMFMEKNNLEIAEMVVNRRIKETVG
ncbi:alpha/beta-hydrolase [Marasmius fiardii PR-910]|nr:alpha/beta-hydrolase [Marasmius fiardii PR-910]